MGERVWFATSNWKDKPSKPSCYTQAQWDARNSSKFNGAPFPSEFGYATSGTYLNLSYQQVAAFDSAKTQSEKYYTSSTAPSINFPDATFLNSIKSQLESIPTPQGDSADCSTGQPLDYTRSDRIKIEINKVICSNPPSASNSTLACDEIDLKLWDGSTYFDTGAVTVNKNWSWTTQGWGCYSTKNNSAKLTGDLQYKIPSSSSTKPLQVCGPGTPIIEISKDTAMQLIWRAKNIDIESANISSSSDYTRDINYTIDVSKIGVIGGSMVAGCKYASGTVTTKQSLGYNVKTKNINDTQPSSSLTEKDIISLNWAPSAQNGFKGSESKAGCGGDTSSNSPDDPNINISHDGQVNGFQGSVDPNWTGPTPDCSRPYLKCDDITLYGAMIPGISGGYNITIKPFDKRQKAFYFIGDKIYFDIRTLIEFNVGGYIIGYKNAKIKTLQTRYEYTSDISINLFGQNYNIPIMKPVDKLKLEFDHVGYNLGGSFNLYSNPLTPIGCFDNSVTVLTTTIGGLTPSVNTSTNMGNLQGSFTIKGVKYYKYATSKGEDVYDEATGNQLKDPLS